MAVNVNVRTGNEKCFSPENCVTSPSLVIVSRMIRMSDSATAARERRNPGFNPLRETVRISREAMLMPVEDSPRRWSRAELNGRMGELVTHVLVVQDLPSFSSSVRGALLEVVNQVASHWLGGTEQGSQSYFGKEMTALKCGNFSGISREYQQRTAEAILMTGATMLTRGGREEQENAALSIVWSYDRDLLVGGDVATLISSLVGGGARDLAQVRRETRSIEDKAYYCSLSGSCSSHHDGQTLGGERRVLRGVCRLQGGGLTPREAAAAHGPGRGRQAAGTSGGRGGGRHGAR